MPAALEAADGPAALLGGAPTHHTVPPPCPPPAPPFIPQLKAEELQLMRPVATQGQRETKKQLLKRALQLQRAGVNLPSSVRLLEERERPEQMPSEEEESSSEGDSSEDEAVEGGSGSESDGGGAKANGGKPPTKKQRTGLAPATAASSAQQQRQQGAAAVPKGTQQQQEQAAAADLKRQSAALREAMVASKVELGISEARDDEPGLQLAGSRAGAGMPAGPGGTPRVVIVQRRPEIQEVRCVCGWGLRVWDGVGVAGAGKYSLNSCSLDCASDVLSPADGAGDRGGGAAPALPQPTPLCPFLLCCLILPSLQGGPAHHRDGAGDHGGSTRPRRGGAVRRDRVRQDHAGRREESRGGRRAVGGGRGAVVGRPAMGCSAGVRAGLVLQHRHDPCMPSAGPLNPPLHTAHT